MTLWLIILNTLAVFESCPIVWDEMEKHKKNEKSMLLVRSLISQMYFIEQVPHEHLKVSLEG